MESFQRRNSCIQKGGDPAAGSPTARGDYPSVRLHDLRHTFAVRRLQRWREQGQSIEHALFWLCTYLGHASIADTYWYLTGVPELMATIGERFEHAVQGSTP